MSRNFVVLGKSPSSISFGAVPAPPAVTVPTGQALSSSPEYSELIRRLFQGPAAVAVVGGNSGASTERVSTIVEKLAAELASGGKLVVIVPVNRILRMNPVISPEANAFAPYGTPHVWLWPGPGGEKLEFFKSRESDDRGNWLNSLRRNFDSVLLDCPHVEGAPGVVEVGVMADAAVLAVEAGLTFTQQVQQDQLALQLRGVKVAGSILIHRS